MERVKRWNPFVETLPKRRQDVRQGLRQLGIAKSDHIGCCAPPRAATLPPRRRGT